jgi:hypothetical protein
MARRANWLKIVRIRINKRRKNFRKICRPRKKGGAKRIFDFNNETLFQGVYIGEILFKVK